MKIECFEFEDKSFPPNSTSLGNWKGRSRENLDAAILWKRAGDLWEGPAARLFKKRSSPEDIAQGQLGDCWLLAALACLSERAGAIERCFETREISVRGLYKLKLYDGQREEWVRMIIDDYLPTEHGQPIFAQPNGREIWVLLLEKAFAKFCGDYQSLAGGHILWAFQAMTGDNVMHFSKEDSKWCRYDMRQPTDENNKRRIGLRKTEPPEEYKDDEFYKILQTYDALRSVMGAGSDLDGSVSSRNGIRPGHAYSIISTQKVNKFCMLQLRDPWGAFDWSGDWSAKSSLWKQHPNVAKACKFDESGKGFFWMEMKDFIRHFDYIDICHRRTGVGDLRLEIDETSGCCGPLSGCMKGCASYYCCCRGCSALCCEQESRTETVRPSKTCCCV
mmetsp:Transcript_12718/g.44536  ORF Transcript_12718/g.44536 Transcript_12718/m.44536 type:complete len:390 (+) Transcript_12718:48-1217(+)